MPEPTDSDLAEIRRLLHDARADGPPPAEVVSRLDETLAGLVAERSEPGVAPAPTHPEATTLGAAAPIDELAVRRTKRRKLFVGAGLVAAATLVAAGFLGQLLGDGESADQAGGGSTSSETLDDEHQDAAPDAAAPSRAPTDAPGNESDSLNGGQSELGAVPGSLDADQARAVRHTLTALGADPKSYRAQLGGAAADAHRDVDTACGVEGDGAADTSVLVVIDGEPRVLVLMPLRADGSREVRVLDCTGTPAELVETVEVPAG